MAAKRASSSSLKGGSDPASTVSWICRALLAPGITVETAPWASTNCTASWARLRPSARARTCSTFSRSAWKTARWSGSVCQFCRKSPELRVGGERAGQDAHRQRPTDNHADVVRLAVGEDRVLGRAVQQAVVNLQRRAAPVVVELLQVVDVTRTHAVCPNLPVLLQPLEAFKEDLHGRLTIVDVALRDVNIVGLQAAQVAFHPRDERCYAGVRALPPLPVKVAPADLARDDEAVPATAPGLTIPRYDRSRRRRRCQRR
jgi:hypothetical protein